MYAGLGAYPGLSLSALTNCIVLCALSIGVASQHRRSIRAVEIASPVAKSISAALIEGWAQNGF
jgi:hypothetical protein